MIKATDHREEGGIMGTTAEVSYDPHDDYTDHDLALMDEDGPWLPCAVCGWSPDLTPKPHGEFVAENTYCTPHDVRVAA